MFKTKTYLGPTQSGGLPPNIPHGYGPECAQRT